MFPILTSKKHRSALLAGVAFWLACAPTDRAQAELADRMQPMNIEADALRYDDARQISVFTGNVIVTKGTIVIRGHQVEVRQDADGHQFGTVIAGQQGLAYYRQKREGLNEFMEGEARRIEYNGQADTVKLIEKAVLRRYKGAALNDQTNGSVIVYDNKTDIFTVDGGAPSSGQAQTSTGRVRAMLTPNAAATPAPAAPAGPQPRLRTSPQMEPPR